MVSSGSPVFRFQTLIVSSRLLLAKAGVLGLGTTQVTQEEWPVSVCRQRDPREETTGLEADASEVGRADRGLELGELEVGGLEVGGLDVGGLEVGGLEMGGLEVGCP